MDRHVLVLIMSALVLAVAAPAHAQVDRRVAEEPTGGINLPATPLAGEHDVRATTVNPAGLHFLGGTELILAVDGADQDAATTSGPGVGLYLGSVLGGKVFPRLGIGLGVEWMRPSRTRLLPDPVSPLRTTISTSMALGKHSAWGLSWHRFDDDGGLDGTTTWDLGVSWRLNNRFAVGGVVRDLNSPTIGTTPVQRRYELEVTSRPTGTDRLDLGLGGRIGERRADLDGWLRASAKVTRGLYLHAAFETRALQIIETRPSGEEEQLEDRDYRLTLGVEVSFGGFGVTTYGAGGIDEDGELRAVGGTVVARLSGEAVPAVQGRSNRIERIDLSGAIGVRQMTAIVLRMRGIARDPAVRGVVLALDGLGGGWASIQELRDEVTRMRTAGKKVFAYLVAGSTRDYYLASACDKIYVDPAGGLRLTGFAGTTMFFRGSFDKVGVAAQFEKIAEYKSAPESYTDVGPSDPAKQMREALYDTMWNEILEAIATGRKLDRAAVELIIENGPYSAGDLAKDKRLVDAVAEPDAVAELIAVELGGLWAVGEAPAERDDRWERPTIAIIYADGDIVDGGSQTVPLLGRKLVGGETLVGALAAARLDPSIKAIVIRIDSPGGSALASELMSREVFKTRGVKPIICSMGDVAASGGYFLAAGCDLIFAEPMTITGSIGIFYGKFDLSGLLAKLGVTTFTAGRGKRADMESMYRPYTEEERAVIKDKLEYLYGRFTGAVAKGRGMTEQKVDDVARGHVWSGKDAMAVGLVDRQGGLGDAIEYAKAQAKIGPDEKVRIIELPGDNAGLLSKLLGGVVRERSDSTLDLFELGVMRDVLGVIPPSVLVQPDVPQARLPFEITWE